VFPDNHSEVLDAIDNAGAGGEWMWSPAAVSRAPAPVLLAQGLAMVAVAHAMTDAAMLCPDVFGEDRLPVDFI
jgi:hypothetical protein